MRPSWFYLFIRSSTLLSIENVRVQMLQIELYIHVFIQSYLLLYSESRKAALRKTNSEIKIKVKYCSGSQLMNCWDLQNAFIDVLACK